MPSPAAVTPATGPALKDDLAASLGFLSKWCMDRGQNEKSPDDENIRILLSLVMQSGELLCGTTLPKIPKHVVAIPARVELTERRWKRFLRWFEEEYEQPMLRHCRAIGAGALIPQRESTGRGGRGNRYEAQYYLSHADVLSENEAREPTDTGSQNVSKNVSEPTSTSRTLEPARLHRRRNRRSTVVIFMALIALIGFMSLLSLLVFKAETKVFVLNSGHLNAEGEVSEPLSKKQHAREAGEKRD